MNNLVIVGRLVSNPEIFGEEIKSCKITLAVNRNFKNEEGVYETDFIPCILYKTIGQTTAEYWEKGDLIGIKGKLQTMDGKLVVVAEKVSFLSSGRK